MQDRADLNVQREKYNKWNGAAGKSAVAGSIGAALGSTAGLAYRLDKTAKMYGLSQGLRSPGVLTHPATLKYLGAAAALGGIGGAIGGYAGKKLRAQVYKNRLGTTGHAKAVAKRNEWQRAMNSAFKGTKYAKQMQNQRKIEKGLKNWANAFEKHYQTGLSRGMSHEQAERYSNDYIAKHGFKPVNSKKRRR